MTHKDSTWFNRDPGFISRLTQPIRDGTGIETRRVEQHIDTLIPRPRANSPHALNSLEQALHPPLAALTNESLITDDFKRD
jgi:hypothetical protein